jgi:hypothetical protein
LPATRQTHTQQSRYSTKPKWTTSNTACMMNPSDDRHNFTFF